MSSAILFPWQAGQTHDMRVLVADVRPDLPALVALRGGLMQRAGEATGPSGTLAVPGEATTNA